MKQNLKASHSFNENSIEISITEAEKTKQQFDKIDKKELKKDTKKEKEEHEKDAIEDDKSKIKKLEKGKPSEKKDAEKKALKKDMKFDKDSKEKVEGDAIRGYPPKPILAETAKDGEYKGKPAKADMTSKQKSGLDKNKDGKITKEDFELLRKKGKKEADGGYGGGDMKKKVTPKKSYAQMLTDIAAERFGKKKEVN